jgi:hypothetical protein
MTVRNYERPRIVPAEGQVMGAANRIADMHARYYSYSTFFYIFPATRG